MESSPAPLRSSEANATEVTPWVVPLLLRRGIHVVSFAYRFAPQASIADILSDAYDAYAWCRAHLVTFLGSAVALDSYAVAGDSAGGTIASLLAQTLSPTPRALLADHALLDLADPYYRTYGEPGELSGEFTEAEVEAASRDHDPANAIMTCPSPGRMGYGEDKLRRAFHSLTLIVGRRQRLHGDVFTLLNRGNPFDAGLRGHTPEERWAYAEKFSPLRRMGGRGGVAASSDCSKSNGNGNAAEPQAEANGRLNNVNGRAGFVHPPTFFIHGDADVVVPVEQSKEMAARLRALAVPVQEYYEPGAGHVFDQRFTVSRLSVAGGDGVRHAVRARTAGMGDEQIWPTG